jgi:hypothetical protein
VSLCAIFVTSLLFGTASKSMSDQNIIVPQVAAVSSTSSVGESTGTLSATPEGVVLTAKVAGFGKYIDENELQMAVVDYYLPQPVALDARGNRFAASVFCSRKTNPYPWPQLRLLVRDANGIVWADSTRLQSRGSLVASDGYEQVETYPYNANELGRVTPWMINRADGKISEFTLPKAPLQFVGFRLISSAKNSYEVAIRDIRWIGSSRFASPYWLFTAESDWSAKNTPAVGRPIVWGTNEMNGSAGSRFGIGGTAPRPFLRPADLRLTPGAHPYSWEILDTAGVNPVATGQGTWNIAAVGDNLLEFPVLPPGTYHIRANVWSAGEKNPRQLFVCYVVVRSNEKMPAPPKPTAGLLTFTTTSGGNVFLDNGLPAPVSITATGGTDAQSIEWTVQGPDQSVVDNGLASATKPFSLNLAKFKASGPTLWVTARLLDGSKVLAIGQRVYGFREVPGMIVKRNAPLTLAKLASSDHRIARTKCDWNEGGTPVVSQAKVIIPQFEAWMDDAKQDKYTIVEFSAPWYDVETVKGVYNWAPLDKLAQEAEARGLKTVFRIHPVYSNIPSWVAREYQQDQDGTANGLWGGSSYLVASPASEALRTGLRSYAEALGAHFRGRASVIGYTLSNVMFDHGWLDQPYLNQFVDYSPPMTRFFVASVKAKYGTLAAVSKAYGAKYTTWDAIKPPLSKIVTDAAGRLKPATSPVWRDWMEAKLGAMRASKNAMMQGLRAGDPACQVGFYADEALAYVSAGYVRDRCFVADGSMEMMFPPALEPFQIRYEPIGKIARTAPLVDVGVTNLLAERPGWNSFNNYVFPQSRLSTLSPTEMEAETRLVQWFSVMDKLYGAKPLGVVQAKSTPAYLYSMQTLFYSAQHTFFGRVQDVIKPYQFQIGAEKVKIDWVPADEIPAPSLASRPYVYVPYCADVLTSKVIDSLAAYVKGGGRIVIEPTSGYWRDGDGTANALGKALGIPTIAPLPTSSKAPESLAIKTANAMFKGVPVAFRTQPWAPPVERQQTPWLQNVPRHYLRSYKASALPQGAVVVAVYPDGSPAAYSLSVGKGKVLVFCGVVDWLSCKNLASAVDTWGHGETWKGKSSGDPTLIMSAFTNNGAAYVVGRRFIGHDEIAKIAGGISMPDYMVPGKRSCVFPKLPAGTYHVRDLVNSTDLGESTAADLAKVGVMLTLAPGQGFLLEAVPAGRK